MVRDCVTGGDAWVLGPGGFSPVGFSTRLGTARGLTARRFPAGWRDRYGLRVGNCLDCLDHFSIDSRSVRHGPEERPYFDNSRVRNAQAGRRYCRLRAARMLSGADHEMALATKAH